MPLSDIDVPSGALRFFQEVAPLLRCPPSRAMETLCVASPSLKDYLEANANRRLDYRCSLATLLGLDSANIHSLTNESHLYGSSVCRNMTSDEVFYSGQRAMPSLFWQLAGLYSQELKCPLFARTLSASGRFFVRPFVQDTEIHDITYASKNAGYLLALAWGTSTTDLHEYNVVFANDAPCVLDDECICHPLREEQMEVLQGSRKYYPFSPFRTTLLRDSGREQQEVKAGFGALFRTGIDYWAFRNAVLDGWALLQKRIDLLADPIIDYSRKGGAIRYLARSTEFYDLCIYRICALLAFSKEVDLNFELNKMFEREYELFPELRRCISYEIEALKRADVPYFLLLMANGQIVDAVTGANVEKVRSVPDWMLLHWANALQLPKERIDKFL